MANLAQTINVLQAVLLTKEEKMILTPTYHVMEMYNVHQDAKLVPLTLKSNDYTFGNEKLTAVSASASKDSTGKLHISLVNIDPKATQEISVDIEGGNYKTVGGRILTAAKLQDHNTFETPAKIKPAAFQGATLNGKTLNVKLPPFSVVVLALK
jgi:alpha-N-arabinofuranosidase